MEVSASARVDWHLSCIGHTVLRTSHHPFALAVKCHASDVARVTFECEDCSRIRRPDVVEFYGMVAGGGEESLVGGDTEAVDLRVGMGYCAGAYTAQGLPEPNGMYSQFLNFNARSKVVGTSRLSEDLLCMGNDGMQDC